MPQPTACRDDCSRNCAVHLVVIEGAFIVVDAAREPKDNRDPGLGSKADSGIRRKGADEGSRGRAWRGS